MIKELEQAGLASWQLLKTWECVKIVHPAVRSKTKFTPFCLKFVQMYEEKYIWRYNFHLSQF